MRSIYTVGSLLRHLPFCSLECSAMCLPLLLVLVHKQPRAVNIDQVFLASTRVQSLGSLSPPLLEWFERTGPAYIHRLRSTSCIWCLSHFKREGGVLFSRLSKLLMQLLSRNQIQQSRHNETSSLLWPFPYQRPSSSPPTSPPPTTEMAMVFSSLCRYYL